MGVCIPTGQEWLIRDWDTLVGIQICLEFNSQLQLPHLPISVLTAWKANCWRTSLRRRDYWFGCKQPSSRYDLTLILLRFAFLPPLLWFSCQSGLWLLFSFLSVLHIYFLVVYCLRRIMANLWSNRKIGEENKARENASSGNGDTWMITL